MLLIGSTAGRFENVHTEQPFESNVAEGGVVGTHALFSQQHFDESSANHCEYTCGGNFFWINHLYSPCPPVLIRDQAVHNLTASIFKERRVFSPPLTVSRWRSAA